MRKLNSKTIAKKLGATRTLDAVQLAIENRQLRQAFNTAKRELAEHKWLFDKQHERARDAEILWREAHGKPDTTPDLGELLEWLMDRGDRWQDVLRSARTIRERFALADKDQIPGLDQLRRSLDRYDEFWQGALK